MIRFFRGGFAAFALLTLALSDTACAQTTTTINALPSATTPLAGSETFPVWQLGATKKVDANHLLPNSGVTAGTYGDATHCPYVTIAADGRITSATNSTSCPGGGGGGGTPGGSTTQLQYNNAGAFGGITSAVFSGGVLTLTSPVLVTPNLGTPSAVTLTNGTGLPIAGISGLGTGVGTWFATPSSANLAAAVTGETGTGNLVFSTSPVLTTPNLGTPSALTLTNASGLPVGGISATGTPSGTTFLRGDGQWATPAGSGNVSGPGSAVGDNVVTFNGTSGTLIKDSGIASTALVTLTGTQTLTNKTLTAPNLGTPTALTLTNATGLPPSTGLSAAVPVNKGGTNCTVAAIGCVTAISGATGTPSSSTYLRGDGTWAAAGGGSGITDLTLGAGLCSSTTNPITAGGATVSWCQSLNAQTGTTYTLLSSDGGKFVTFANAGSVAVTVPQATGSFAAGYGTNLYNNGAGVATLTPTTSTIAGLTSLPLQPGQGISLASDGTNYDAIVGLPQIANSRFFGNNSGATSYGNAMTGTQATALLDTFTTGLKGLAPASGGGTTNFLRADGTWAAPPGGGSGCSVSGTQYQLLVVNAAGTACDADASATANAGALTLGASGTLGQITFGNATSGTLNLQPVTGALGTASVKIPTGGTLVSSTTAIPVVTGTPSSSTYLRGDGTWATPAGGGGGGYAPSVYVINRFYTWPDQVIGGTGSVIGATTTRWYPVWVGQSVTISQLGVRVFTSSAGGNVQISIYATDTSTGLPTGSPLATTASISTTTAGSFMGALGSNLSLTVGTVYWIGVQVDNGTAALTAINSVWGGASAAVGAATVGNLIGGSGGNMYWTSTSTFGTWATNPTLTENNGSSSAISPATFFKVASIP